MPGEDGLSLARHLRERYERIAIVMLTSSGTVVDRIVGLEMGADDYVPKPFDPRELLARIKSVLRRTSDAEIRRHRCEQSAHRPVRTRPRCASTDGRRRRGHFDDAARIRPPESIRRAPEPGAVARAHIEPEPAAR